MNTNQLQLCSLEQSKQLKAAGFDWPTISYWDTSVNIRLRHHYKPIDHNNDAQYAKEEWGKYISAPTVAHALKFLRDEKGIIGIVNFCGENCLYYYTISFRQTSGSRYKKIGESYESYELAESALLDELLTLIEKENGQTN